MFSATPLLFPEDIPDSQEDDSSSVEDEKDIIYTQKAMQEEGGVTLEELIKKYQL